MIISPYTLRDIVDKKAEVASEKKFKKRLMTLLSTFKHLDRHN